jgi:hypothetical protein
MESILMPSNRLFPNRHGLLSLALFTEFIASAASAEEKPAADLAIADKTLVAWVSPANLTQRG